MIIESVRVTNYRSILDETLQCGDLTALVGANGTGKSSFLKALDLFYSPNPKVEPEDFYGGDTAQEITVSIIFKVASEEAKQLFSGYMQGEYLTVERVFSGDGGKATGRYHGASLQAPAFEKIREGLELKDRGKTAKLAYEEVRRMPQYSGLPAWSNIGAAQESLKAWEIQNPDMCTRQRDDGQFFGFKEVGQGYLGRFTRFLFIPAVRDASEDASEGRNSVLTGLMDLVVRSVLASKESVMKLKEETQRQYEEIMDPSKLTELGTLAEQLTGTLRTFVPDARVDLRWMPLDEVNIPLPQADIKLVEDGYAAAVGRTGHGLQRAFIVTMLQHLALAQTSTPTPHEDSGEQDHQGARSHLPNFALAIEEPELYQHPSRQRHLARILNQLATGSTPGVADKTQIIYGTHSPLFVGIERMEQVRLLRKVPAEPEKPKVTKIVSTDLDKVAQVIWKAEGQPNVEFSGRTLAPRLRSVMTPWMSEGFFADVAVLVEGEDDRAAMLGIASALGHQLESDGIAVIPCGGKTCLDRPAAIFRQFGIPVYVIWDGDEGDNEAKPEDNHRLLRLMGQDVVDWPSGVHSDFACFSRNLETTLGEEVGQDEFNAWLTECQGEYCIPKKKHAIKNPAVIEGIIRQAKQNGRKSATLESIIDRILELRTQTQSAVGVGASITQQADAGMAGGVVVSFQDDDWREVNDDPS